jgi:two-component system, NtrC family, response regulator HydG
VLITGESGTGKELVAEALHHCGMRRQGPLVKVNCAALPDSLLESELFGHVKGAFTGAAMARVGRFQRADGGTLLLDEIGDVSPRLQLALLRVLQDGQVERLGDSRPIHVDVRVVASTNRNLAQRVARGEFREDLFYRLKVAEIALPPLRERREDIPLLIEHVVERLNRKLRREIRGVAPEVERVCLEHAWPGNVRELEHALEHAFIRCREDVVRVEHLPDEVARVAPFGAGGSLDEGNADAIRRALKTSGGNKAKAARLLGIDRKTLYRKLTRYGLEGA